MNGEHRSPAFRSEITASAPVDVPASAAAPLTPISSSERIVTLDVLRGIALFGVLVANIWLWFSGIYFRFPDYNAEVWSGSLDGIVFLSIAFFIATKAMATFSFLFGLGFAIQMTRAEQRGRSVGRFHARRMAVLLLIGAIHAVFIWYGDILFTYALLGFALLLFRRRSNRTLVVWAFMLAGAVPILLGALPFVAAQLSPDALPEPATILTEMRENNAALLGYFTSGELAQYVRGNLAMLKEWWLTPKAFMQLGVFGMFLLGLHAGRRRIFENPAAHRTLLRRLMLFGYPIGIVASAVGLGFRSLPMEQMLGIPWIPLVFGISAALGTLPLALAYIATATTLMERTTWRTRLLYFAPVGRMALTNYLAQSLICVAFFYGGGFVGQVGAVFGLLVALIVFPLQMAFSAWWLARYRFGPMEWLWRSSVYGRLQPMRITPASVPAVRPELS